MRTEVHHHEGDQRFVAVTDGLQSVLRYREVGESTLDLVSTFVHREVRGRGVGERLVTAALDYAREEGYDVIPSCWFVGTVIERHPRYRDLLVP